LQGANAGRNCFLSGGCLSETLTRPSLLCRRLLPRLAAASLSLLPHPRLAFDLTGYCPHPLAKKLITTERTSQLLSHGVLYIPAVVPPDVCAFLNREGGALSNHLTDLSTTRRHLRRGWLFFDEAPPRAPEPPPAATPLPATWYGSFTPIAQESSPALCGCIRFLRGVGAALEEVSSLRLAVPRGAVLEEHLSGGYNEEDPPNNGWPDTGVEVCCSLFLGASHGAGESAVHLHPHEGERVLATAAAGGLLLTLARQVRTHMPPAPVDGGIVGCSVRRWLTMHIYSSWQRGHDGDRILGMTNAKMQEHRQALAPMLNGPDAHQKCKAALGET